MAPAMPAAQHGGAAGSADGAVGVPMPPALPPPPALAPKGYEEGGSSSSSSQCPASDTGRRGCGTSCDPTTLEDKAAGATASKSPRVEAGAAAPTTPSQRAVPPGGVSNEAEVASLTQRADLYASRGWYTEALQLVEEAIRLDPTRAELHLGCGQCYASLKRYDEAIACFERCLREHPGHKVACRRKAAVYVEQKRWAEATVCMRQALELDPGSSDARRDLAHCLTEQGVQNKVSGSPSPQLFREAVRICDSYAPGHFQLGVEYSEVNNPALAKDSYSKAVQLMPDYVEAWNNLGCACRSLQELDHAREAYGMALKVNQNCTKTKENMACCLLEMACAQLQKKELKRSGSLLKEALTYDSKNANIYFNLGVMYAERQKFDRAKVNYELAVYFDETHANSYNNLGVIHRRFLNLEAAVTCFERALKASPTMNLANKNLGAVYGQMGRMAEALMLTARALKAEPQDAEAYNNLALLYRDQCDVDVCLEHLDACVRLEPENRHAHSNRLMTLNYQSEKSRSEVFEEHRRWGEQLESRVPVQYTSWPNSNNHAAGLLRVGYISPDFYSHSVSYFIHAALRYHDPTYVHVTCYSDVAVEDAKTAIFKAFVPRWRTIIGLSDDEVARMIHDDGIDVLVDLTGHTGNNRLGAFARRPAPVLVTWIGYPHTTGLSCMDFRISDTLADPPEMPGLTTEKLAYLTECFLCYTPPENAPCVGTRPAQETYGSITFGCFNNLAKVSTLTIGLWCRVLQEVPESRLFLKSKALQCSEVQEKFRRAFAAFGIEGRRLDLSGLQSHTGSHLQMYSFVDVALDTAPYAGTTTTCESLYMGVPVVSLKGKGIHAQNVGATLLSAVGLADLAAQSEEEYVQKAASLARNVTRLSALRAGLRSRMLRSVLCDGPLHTSRLERLYGELAASRGVSCSDNEDVHAEVQ